MGWNMAQRPPRMPRRSTPGAQAPGPAVPEDATAPASELPTDALNIVQLDPPAQAPAPRSAAKSGYSGNYTPKAKVPLRERAKEKQHERRREDRVKFSAAVRRSEAEAEATAPAPAAPVDGKPVAAQRFSGRIAVLIVLVAFFAMLLVPTVNYYRTQVVEINELQASLSSLKQERDDLKDEIARWEDPLYIKQQARERINLVMPGEKLYMVVGEHQDDQKSTSSESTYEVRQELPWVDALLDSVRRSATD